MSKHTPGPWKVGYRDEASNELVITDDDRDEGNIDKMIPVCRVVPQPFYRDNQGDNAAFIVRACNSHTAMLEALKAVVDGWHENDRNFYKAEPKWLKLTRQAIAQAEGKV